MSGTAGTSGAALSLLSQTRPLLILQLWDLWDTDNTCLHLSYKTEVMNEFAQIYNMLCLGFISTNIIR